MTQPPLIFITIHIFQFYTVDELIHETSCYEYTPKTSNNNQNNHFAINSAAYSDDNEYNNVYNLL